MVPRKSIKRKILPTNWKKEELVSISSQKCHLQERDKQQTATEKGKEREVPIKKASQKVKGK